MLLFRHDSTILWYASRAYVNTHIIIIIIRIIIIIAIIIIIPKSLFQAIHKSKMCNSTKVSPNSGFSSTRRPTHYYKIKNT